jgi:hypothetical protein
MMTEIATKMQVLLDKQDELAENINKIKEAVYNPDKGLYARLSKLDARLDALESWKNNNSKILWIIITVGVGLVPLSPFLLPSLSEDVLAEAAKIINLSADDMQQMIGLFNDSQKELRGESDETNVVNVNKCLEMLDEFRKALYNMDTRLGEIVEIVIGYDEYQRGLSNPVIPSSKPLNDPSPGSISEDEPELFGAD